MSAMPRLVTVLLLALSPAAFTASNTVQTEQVRAELIAHAPDGVGHGKAVWLGLKLEHIPHWHTYWKNPGDSGLPTTLSWTLPAGVTAGDVDWPAPSRLALPPLMNFGYEGTIVLPVPLTIGAIDGDHFPIQLEADWLVCKVECIPQSGSFHLDLPVREPIAIHAADFERALAARPLPSQATAVALVEDGTLRFEVRGLPPSLRQRDATVFPEVAGVVENAAAVSQQWVGEAWQASWPLAAQRSESPTQLPLVLVFGDDTSLRVIANVSGWPAMPSARVGATAPTAQPLSLATALLFALIGGVILNLMPCVFPVLSLKVLSLAQHTGRERVTGAMAYTAGVILSFLALAGLLIAARAGGEQLGWGFQLQAPGTVAALAALFTLIGLNLAGVFEVGSLLPSRIASLRARDPTLDSFLTGVLAAAVASPCTAPFMGAALGAALTWPVTHGLAVFAALGLGVAVPYLLVSLVPALGRLLPRPGRWMESFKIALAFPMFATVVWLSWVLGHQVGIDGAAALWLALLALALGAWWWGRRPESGPGRFASSVAILLLTAGAFAWAVPLWRTTPSATSAVVGGAWQPWSPERVAELRGAGRKVFVDFTAAWCVTCQYNKRTTLADPDVLAAFAAQDVALLRADWTSRDPIIAAELATLGRSGVPVYAFYDGIVAPRLLSELPSVEEIRSAVLGPSSGR